MHSVNKVDENIEKIDTLFPNVLTEVIKGFKKLNAFLQFNEKDILENAGKVTAAIAKEFAESEFGKHRIIQDRLFQSDFDRLASSIENDED